MPITPANNKPVRKIRTPETMKNTAYGIPKGIGRKPRSDSSGVSPIITPNTTENIPRALKMLAALLMDHYPL